MSIAYIGKPDGEVKNYYPPNIITVAQTYYSSLRLTKTIYNQNSIKPTDTPKYYNFFEVEIFSIADLARLIQYCMNKPRVCFIRARIKDKCIKVERKSKGAESTLVCQPQNWFAIDVDGYGTYTGNVKQDAHSVLLALGWQNTECIALASSSYGIKPNIHMRLFFWADILIENVILKKLLRNNKAKVDLALFNPIQPIYVATPIFANDMIDPIEKRFAFLPGLNRCVMIPENITYTEGYKDKPSTKRQAKSDLNKAFKIVSEAESGSRHEILREQSRWMGKLVLQELLDEEDVFEALIFACITWGEGDRKKDEETIRYGIKMGIEQYNGEF
jgi:hypothetical protein